MTRSDAQASVQDVALIIGDAMFFGNDRLDFEREHLAMEEAA